MGNVAASVLARLKNKSKEQGIPYEKDSVVVIVRLAKDSQIQKRWDNFCPNGGGDRLKRTMLKGIVLSVS
ncbi:hypothetical protein L0P54_03050 [Anaerosalibacter bizertensis]|uniref:Uncharacterized protein n=1 Tax=Anaerosalibacter bizertensis TaxID=932217 RepID=A0A9Q4FLK4_9FIRM|nr:hypothetical protein [Anaerosalibacter bizertensis]MBV1819418.1 hypothetical protein [Bacteroidales bacterium MSK.15.36]MCB5560264.1 hypothetical protein [Anaerosalibacter bizertensis]MCG4564953.1 hypothetical protein [Anaerosalibacter bizertensis]MCG4581953.1 hypothetical protein [Anaerosalibacter bizertensis]MCG4585580.1 hypothetical protein [Anaerosalibacter bizertensis]